MGRQKSLEYLFDAGPSQLVCIPSLLLEESLRSLEMGRFEITGFSGRYWSSLPAQDFPADCLVLAGEGLGVFPPGLMV